MITALKVLAGGWSGAYIYLVSVRPQDSQTAHHLVLKLDRKNPLATSDESSRHRMVLNQSPPEFVAAHIPAMEYEPVEADGILAIFYAIAGQSLLNFRTLSQHKRQQEIEILFSETNRYLLQEWNGAQAEFQVSHPQALFKRWLGFRLDPGQKIENFLRDDCLLNPDIPGFIIQGSVFPNPLFYARNRDPWGGIRNMDTLNGLQHGDLNTNNILAKFHDRGDTLEGFYLIDFALSKEGMPLLYDQRYLEISFLVHALQQTSLKSTTDLIVGLSEREFLEDAAAPIEMAGINAAVRSGRRAFHRWVDEHHPSLQDDLWGQYWLAGVAAGLSYCHKAGQPAEIRLAGLMYAAANLKQFFRLFGLAMPAEAGRLFDGDRDAAAPAGAPDASKHNLPSQATKFIGRDDEIQALSDLIAQPDVRLVTLTGPGGTGKTRLSIETGRTLQQSFAHGVFFVDLAPIRDPALFATTAAHAVGIREGGSRPPMDNLKDYLSNRQVLLLMDNFEQITGAAVFIAELLAAAPRVKALVTSRIALHLKGEHEFPVHPLSVPSGENLTPDELLKSEAANLFLQQARAVRPDFEITAENSSVIADICCRLDGLPLAIEIAAARTRMLSPHALQKRLNERLKLLVGGARDLPERQQTLRQAIDWSYDMLEEEVQQLFNRLGVFSGGFTLESAEQVCNPQGMIDIFTGIETLLENSLIHRTATTGEDPRFNMLQTLREYALEKAGEQRALDDLRSAHLRFYTEFSGGPLEKGVYGPQSLLWLRRIEEEHDNFRSALEWAMQSPERYPAAVTIMLPLAWFWFRYGHLQEGRDWTQRALDLVKDDGPSPILAMALLGRSLIAMWSGDLRVATELSEKALELSERLNMDIGISNAKLSYGVTLINRGRDREAYPHLVDAIELFDQQDDDWKKGTTLVHLANVSLGMGSTEEALKWLDIAMPYMKSSQDPWNLAFALNNYGEVARSLGDYDKAEQYYRQTEKYFELADAVGDQARLVHSFGYIELHKGHTDAAKDLFRKSLSDFRKLGNHRGIAECLAGLAGVAVKQGRHAWAAPLLCAAEQQLESFGGVWWPADRVEIEHCKAELQEKLGDSFTDTWMQGQFMDVEDSIRYAMRDGEKPEKMA